MPEFQDISAAFPNDPDADNLYEGTQVINGNTLLMRPRTVSFSTILVLDRQLVDAGYQALSSNTSFSVGSDVLPGATLQFRISGGSLSWPSQVESLAGTYDPERVNLVTVRVLSGTDAASAKLSVLIEPSAGLGLTGLVFRQDARTDAGQLQALSEALDINDDSLTPSSELLYSRMGQLESFRQPDGYFYFTARWFTNGAQTGTDVKWRQRSNPGLLNGPLEVDGYQAISGTAQLAITGQSFGGLALHANTALFTWTVFPKTKSVDALSEGTIGTTLYVDGTPQDNTVPGISPANNTVELYADAAP